MIQQAIDSSLTRRHVIGGVRRVVGLQDLLHVPKFGLWPRRLAASGAILVLPLGAAPPFAHVQLARAE